jgi:hypothetical protein
VSEQDSRLIAVRATMAGRQGQSSHWRQRSRPCGFGRPVVPLDLRAESERKPHLKEGRKAHQFDELAGITEP